MFKNVGMLAILAGVVLGVSSMSSAATIALDLGDISTLVYSGTYDGENDFQPLVVTSGYTGGRDQNPSTTVGGVTISFANVGMWGAGIPVDEADPLALYYDFFHFSVDSDTTFTISGLNESDVVTVSFLNSVQNFAAYATFDGGSEVAILGHDAFTEVGTATGSTSYSGTVAGPAAGGEGNLSAMRITITPEPMTMSLLGLGGLGMLLRRKR